MAAAATELIVEGVPFPATVKPLGSSEVLILGGAGVRGLDIQGKFIKFTAIGVYVGEPAVGVLAGKWKGKTADELAGSVDFFRDIVTGPFEKFTRVSMILPLTGLQYADKVTENCVTFWKSVGIYTDEEAAAVEQFKQVFKDQVFPPGSSILFTQSPSGELTVRPPMRLITIGFSHDGSIPAAAAASIKNRNLAEAILESIIGEHGVSPDAKRSLASRLCQFWIGTEANEGSDLQKVIGGSTPVLVTEETVNVAST